LWAFSTVESFLAALAWWADWPRRSDRAVDSFVALRATLAWVAFLAARAGRADRSRRAGLSRPPRLAWFSAFAWIAFLAALTGRAVIPVDAVPAVLPRQSVGPALPRRAYRTCGSRNRPDLLDGVQTTEDDTELTLDPSQHAVSNGFGNRLQFLLGHAAARS